MGLRLKHALLTVLFCACVVAGQQTMADSTASGNAPQKSAGVQTDSNRSAVDIISLTQPIDSTRPPATQPMQPKQQAPEPIVIPIPTSFWTGLVTLVLAGLLYHRRKLRFH